MHSPNGCIGKKCPRLAKNCNGGAQGERESANGVDKTEIPIQRATTEPARVLSSELVYRKFYLEKNISLLALVLISNESLSFTMHFLAVSKFLNKWL